MRELKVGHTIILANDGKKYKVVSRKQEVFELRKTGLAGWFKPNRQIWIRSYNQYRIIK